MPGLIHAAGATPLTLAGTNLTLVVVVAVIAVVALIMGVIFRRQVLAADPGTAKMQEIGQAVEEGAHAYLARQFKTLSVFVVIVFFLLMALPADTAGIRFGRSGFFVLGAIFSAAVGYFGMSLAVKANVRVASAANNSGRDEGMRIAHTRRDGQGDPVPAAVTGKACKCSGLTRINPVTAAVTAARRASSAVIAREAGGAAHPTVMPSSHSSTLGANVTWQKRLASGGDNSQPSEARSGGLAPATTRTPSGK